MEKLIYYKSLCECQYIQGFQTIETVKRNPADEEGMDIYGPKRWEGKINIETDVTSSQVNIGDYFPEFNGIIFLESLKKGLVSFQGSGPLYFKNKLAF